MPATSMFLRLCRTDYLAKVSARDAEELAVTQIKGVKLLFWAMILGQVELLFSRAVHAAPQVPSFPESFARSVAGRPCAWWQNWAALLIAFFATLLGKAIWGHKIIGCLRLMGFKMLRNTYRPLGARTLADFWNRFYFYFKELLVDLFFYPTYFSVFKRSPRLRLFVSTMVAAGVGNAIFHFVSGASYIPRMGFRGALAGFEVYLFYCLVLSLGIAISQLRNQKRKPRNTGWFRANVLPAVCVWGFFCIVHVFDQTDRSTRLTDHFRFVGHLIGF